MKIIWKLNEHIIYRFGKYHQVIIWIIFMIKDQHGEPSSDMGFLSLI